MNCCIGQRSTRFNDVTIHNSTSTKVSSAQNFYDELHTRRVSQSPPDVLPCRSLCAPRNRIQETPRANPSISRIARDLGQHARGGDGITPRVALHDGRLRHAHCPDRTAVHNRVLRWRIQLRQRVVHRAMRGLQDVYIVNLRRVNPGDEQIRSRRRRSEAEEFFALRGGELLGIVQAGESGGQTDSAQRAGRMAAAATTGQRAARARLRPHPRRARDFAAIHALDSKRSESLADMKIMKNSCCGVHSILI